MSTLTDETSPALSLDDLVRAYQADIWRYLRYQGCDSAQADDLTQETFVEIWRKPFQQRNRSATAAYLRTVARHRLLMARRKERRAPPAAELEAAEEVWARQTRHGWSAYQEALDACLDGLGERARRAVQLKYGEGATRDAMARSLDLTPDGVKTLLRRTRERLRACISRRLSATEES